MNADQVFLGFVRGLFILMLLFGAGMTAVILLGDTTIGYRMVNVFGSMFAGVLGLGSGYLLGRNSEASKRNGKEDTHDRS